MRDGVPALLVAIGLSGCQASAPPPPPAGPPQLAAASPRRPPPEPRDRTADVEATALRRYLLQLLPCDREAGELELLVSLGDDGYPRAVEPGASSVPPETARCAADAVTRWRFPYLRPSRRELRLQLAFPLRPPSLQEHAPVLLGGGRVDLEAVGGELRRLRPRVLPCLKGRPAGAAVLLALRLGSWGKLLQVRVEDEGRGEAEPRGARTRERACLKRALRLGEFPNPDGEVELRYPYVLDADGP